MSRNFKRAASNILRSRESRISKNLQSSGSPEMLVKISEFRVAYLPPAEQLKVCGRDDRQETAGGRTVVRPEIRDTELARPSRARRENHV